MEESKTRTGGGKIEPIKKLCSIIFFCFFFFCLFEYIRIFQFFYISGFGNPEPGSYELSVSIFPFPRFGNPSYNNVILDIK